jgi:hypothetical protein
LQVAVLSFPALKPRLQEIFWLLLSLNSSASAIEICVANNDATPRQILMTWFIRITPVTYFSTMGSRLKRENNRVGSGKSQA